MGIFAVFFRKRARPAPPVGVAPLQPLQNIARAPLDFSRIFCTRARRTVFARFHVDTWWSALRICASPAPRSGPAQSCELMCLSVPAAAIVVSLRPYTPTAMKTAHARAVDCPHAGFAEG